MSEYKTLRAIGHNGTRYEKGTVVELTDKEAKAIGSEYVVPATNEPADDATVEKKVEEMTHAELKALAGEMGLATSGAKPDLIERINLAKQEPEAPVDGEEDSEEDK